MRPVDFVLLFEEPSYRDRLVSMAIDSVLVANAVGVATQIAAADV